MRIPARRLGGTRTITALTLVEIMVVVLIMGMIAGLVTKVVIDRLQEAKVETARTQIAELVDTLELFYMDNDFYPSSDQGLRALEFKPATGRIPKKWPLSGYMSSIPKDPWGNNYDYVSPGAVKPFEIISYGRDGEVGGEGFDADVRSWELGGAGED